MFVAIRLDARLNFHEVIALERCSHAIEPVPLPRLDAAGGIAQFDAQVGFPLAGGANFLFTDEKVSGDGLAVLEARYEALFHVPDFFFGKIPSLLLLLLDLESSFSGAAATSSIGSAFTAAVSV